MKNIIVKFTSEIKLHSFFFLKKKPKPPNKTKQTPNKTKQKTNQKHPQTSITTQSNSMTASTCPKVYRGIWK